MKMKGYHLLLLQNFRNDESLPHRPVTYRSLTELRQAPYLFRFFSQKGRVTLLHNVEQPTIIRPERCRA